MTPAAKKRLERETVNTAYHVLSLIKQAAPGDSLKDLSGIFSALIDKALLLGGEERVSEKEQADFSEVSKDQLKEIFNAAAQRLAD